MEIICLDSSVLIEFFRKQKKEKSFLYQLGFDYEFTLPSIVKYEVFRGDYKKDPEWTAFVNNISVLPFENDCAEVAAAIFKNLKSRNKLIGSLDILIAAIVKKHRYKLATLNQKDFERVEGLQLITPSNF